MDQPVPEFRAPSAPERVFNRVFGALVGWGLAPRGYYLLHVRGRRTGRVYRTPVNLIEVGGTMFLVAPRGRTQWVRNAEATGEVTLARGPSRRRYRTRPVPDAGKPPVLCAYLDRFKAFVQRYFPVPAGSPIDEFGAIAGHYPVFELIPFTGAEGMQRKGAR